MNIKSILNVLALLKEEPKDIGRLWESDYFQSWGDLKKALRTCFKAGFIRKEYFGRQKLSPKEVMSQNTTFKRWHKNIYCYYLTDLGLTFLSFFSKHKDWQPKQVIRKEKAVI